LPTTLLYPFHFPIDYLLIFIILKPKTKPLVQQFQIATTAAKTANIHLQVNPVITKSKNEKKYKNFGILTSYGQGYCGTR